jgi:hypothetical protein
MGPVASARLRTSLPALALAAVLLGGCVPNAPYRTTAGICDTPGCRTGSIERHVLNADPPIEYLLAVVEFDDQGAKQLPEQMDALFAQLKAESAAQDLCLVVFVHGWQHNAQYDDTNMQEFRLLLEQLARTEGQHPGAAWGRPRKAVGIYAGWRGKSLDAGDLSDLTFWNRKDAAQRVALGSVRELLGRARALHDTLDRTTWSGRLLQAGAPVPPGEKLRSTRLLTIGHSFGGLIVYTAVAQYFTDRAAAAATAIELGDAQDADKAIPPYGDLVVIVNPAVEAISWEPIRQIVEDRKARDFAPNQNPVFVEVTSTADDATGIAFPLGRSLDTVSESFTSSEERREAQVAFGHYEPFLTHDLINVPGAAAPQWVAALPARLAQVSPAEASVAGAALEQVECEARAKFEAEWRRDGYLLPGWTRQFSAGARLKHLAESGYDPNDPFWIVSTNASMIAGHSDINEPQFVNFVSELYDGLLRDRAVCGPAR